MVGHGGSSAGSYLADPTSPIPSHCASVVATSTLRVNFCNLCCIQVTNSEGTWIKLDSESGAHYCHDQEGEAWSLARDTDGIVYLQHELDAAAAPGSELGGELEDTAATVQASVSPHKGFDFTTAPQTPSFTAFGVAAGDASAQASTGKEGWLVGWLVG